MTQEKWITVVEAFKAGREQSFEKRLIPFYKRNQFQLFKLTQSKETAWNVFVESMINFREQFLIGNERLPNNINGYIFQSQRNIWIDVCRKQNKKRQIQTKTVEVAQLEGALSFGNTVTAPEPYHWEAQDSEASKLIALEKAISKLCDSCRKLIERNVFDKIRLKVLKEEMNYTSSYQAIVEKKKRCMKKLTKLFFLELNQI